MKIESFKLKDSDDALEVYSEVVELWYEASIKAHHFISPDYWRENKEAMATIHLPKSENYVAIKEKEIVGFIAMLDNYLAAIFVKVNRQGEGTGTKLLAYIKERRAVIQLKAYKKNTKSVDFYKKQGFEILSESKEEITNEMEFLMEWKK